MQMPVSQLLGPHHPSVPITRGRPPDSLAVGLSGSMRRQQHPDRPVSGSVAVTLAPGREDRCCRPKGQVLEPHEGHRACPRPHPEGYAGSSFESASPGPPPGHSRQGAREAGAMLPTSEVGPGRAPSFLESPPCLPAHTPAQRLVRGKAPESHSAGTPARVGVSCISGKFFPSAE